jgi:hypothetical protein
MSSNPLEAEPSPSVMGFTEFLAWSQQVSRTDPHVKRLCETRIARAFAQIQR